MSKILIIQFIINVPNYISIHSNIICIMYIEYYSLDDVYV